MVAAAVYKTGVGRAQKREERKKGSTKRGETKMKEEERRRRRRRERERERLREPTDKKWKNKKQAPGTQELVWDRRQRKGPNSALGGSAICCLDAADERGLQATGE
jgi:hypothetical protein